MTIRADVQSVLDKIDSLVSAENADEATKIKNAVNTAVAQAEQDHADEVSALNAKLDAALASLTANDIPHPTDTPTESVGDGGTAPLGGNEPL